MGCHGNAHKLSTSWDVSSLFVRPKMALQKSEDEKFQKKRMEKIYEEMVNYGSNLGSKYGELVGALEHFPYIGNNTSNWLS